LHARYLPCGSDTGEECGQQAEAYGDGDEVRVALDGEAVCEMAGDGQEQELSDEGPDENGDDRGCSG
jgi:hypothetical protein